MTDKTLPPTKPSFFSQGSWEQLSPPLRCRDATMSVFVLRADEEALKELCDTRLNHPSQGAVQYRPATPYVMLTFHHIKKLFATHQGKYLDTSIEEKQVDLRIAVVDEKKIGGLEVVRQISMFVPWALTNHPWAMLSAREWYGFPKELGTIHLPTQATTPQTAAFAVSPHLWHQPLTTPPIPALTITPIVPEDDEPPVSLFGALKQVVGGSVKNIGELLASGEITLPGLSLVRDFAECLYKRAIPLLSIKQQRRPGRPQEALHQTITTVLMRDLFLRKVWPINGEFVLERNKLPQDHPMMTLFPHNHHTIPVQGAFRIEYDFVMDTGKLTWSSTTESIR